MGRGIKDTKKLPEDNVAIATETEQKELIKQESVGLKMDVVEQNEYSANIIFDYYGKVDIFYLSKKDPNFEYRYLRDDQDNLSIKTGDQLFKHGGWKLCPREHLKRIGIEDRFISPDGFHRRGKLILAFMPKKLAYEKNFKKHLDANEPLKQINRFVKDGDQSVAGIGHPNMKGLQTPEQLGMS